MFNLDIGHKYPMKYEFTDSIIGFEKKKTLYDVLHLLYC